MALPPERISIKRRRQDEPIETLVLESDSARDKKRRFTDFYFQRLRHAETTVPVPSSISLSTEPPAITSNRGRNYTDLGIPVIRTSAPGDEVRDFAVYKATQTEKTNEASSAAIGVAGARSSSSHREDVATYQRSQATAAKRRFHLMRDLSSVLQQNSTGGLRRPNVNLRPPVATFMERQANAAAPVHLQPPVDRILELNHEPSTDQTAPPLSEDSISRRTKINTFLKSTNSSTKRGYSIQDDPSTWDQDSDQLANELAALAFEIDPADATEPPQIISPTRSVAVTDVVSEQTTDESMIVDDNNNDFIFETYIRVRYNPSVNLGGTYQNDEVGILIIDDENEDLWEKYIRSDDDDDDWDEDDEDSNAEDNPRNDYPDDEVSSDDEHGRNVYKYRRNASDDEEYDEV